MSLSGQTALVTGGARGIGQATAWALARAGADVAFCDVCSEAEALNTLEGIRAAGRRSVFYRTDVGDRTAVLAMFASLLEEFGHLDILVNNAGINIRKPLLELEAAEVEKVWSVGLWGVFHCTQAAARHMAPRRSGSVIMISSVHAVRPFPNSSAYNGAKAAINHMAQTWAAELAPYRIRVNVVEPGWTNTPGERTHYTEEQLTTLGQALPLGRLADPSEIASAVLFLVSNEASYVTGSSVRVDGGILLPKIPES
jgi:glucose 1-dehydrogenase